jgi:uncharacterized RDD family membrane protein YckC
VKCPKCDYLGFETGDRCRNCGYDFSLLSVAESEPADYEIHPAPIDDVPVHTIKDEVDDFIDDTLRIANTPDAPFEEHSWLKLGADFPQAVTTSQPEAIDQAIDATIDEAVDEPPRPSAVVPFMSPPTASSSDAVLPLFAPAEPHDDEPLIKLPAVPRPPLAVRRTPDTPRFRALPRPMSRPASAPVLQFSEDVERSAPTQEAERRPDEHGPSSVITGQPSRPGARVMAVLIDYLILLGIDAAVVYFTVRMAGLSLGQWRLLPATPLLTFLGLLKVAYFYAFTAVGGQTIGKMAVGTCVVSDTGTTVDAARAMRRTSAGALSFLLLGLGFLPALFGDHRALHDRLAGTRVVRLRSV